MQDCPDSEVFPNLPNFREAGGGGLVTTNGLKVRKGMIFRSSRTDFLTTEEKAEFYKLGIKSIIDLRHIDEYHKANGDKLLDDVYPVSVMKKGKIKEFRGKTPADAAPYGRRYLINMMTMDFIFNILSKVNFFIRYSSLLILIVDKLFDVHLFMRFYNWKILNTRTMHEQYVDLLEFGKSAVADILRIMIDSSPSLIHCAHGKDRTGVVVAMILGCLGVSDEDIAQDYGMSYVSQPVLYSNSILCSLPDRLPCRLDWGPYDRGFILRHVVAMASRRHSQQLMQKP